MKKLLIALFLFVSVAAYAESHRTAQLPGEGNKLVITQAECSDKILEIISYYEKYEIAKGFPIGAKWKAGVTHWEGVEIVNCWTTVETGILILDEWDELGVVELNRFSVSM